MTSLERQTASVLQILSAKERENLDKRLRSLQDQQNSLRDAATEKQKKLTKEVSSRQSIQGDLDKVTDWLIQKEQMLQDRISLPLHPKDLTRAMENKKVIGSISCHKIATHIVIFIQKPKYLWSCGAVQTTTVIEAFSWRVMKFHYLCRLSHLSGISRKYFYQDVQ